MQGRDEPGGDEKGREGRDTQGRDGQEARRTPAPTPGAMVGITIPTTPLEEPIGGGDHE